MTLINACGLSPKKSSEDLSKVVATAYGEKLYISEIPGLSEPLTSSQDSQTIILNYAKNWAAEKAMINKAKDNLSLAKKDEISDRIKAYESSLSVYEYEKQLIAQKMDTTIPIKVLEDYYKKYFQNYTLESSIVKFSFIKNFESPQLPTLKSLITNKDKQKELKSFVLENVLDAYLEDEWKEFSFLRSRVPDSLATNNQLMQKGSLVVINKAEISMLIWIKDIKPAGTAAPFEMVQDDIRKIILGRKKAEYISKAKIEIFQKAIKKNKVKIY
jgi:hypothetical protein